jgi:hypothetical protein
MLAVFGVLFFAFQGTAQAGVGSEKLDSFLKKKAVAGAGGWTSVIVQTPGGAPAELRKQLAAVGAVNIRSLPLVGAIVAKVPNDKLESIAAVSGVRTLSEDVPVLKLDEFTVGASGA